METAVEKGIAMMIATVKIQLNASFAMESPSVFSQLSDMEERKSDSQSQI